MRGRLIGIGCAVLGISVMVGAQVDVGDPLNKIYATFGTPKIEYPLNGVFIHRYDNCTVKSRAGKVQSIEYKNRPPTVAESKTESGTSVSVSDIKLKALEGVSEAQFMLAYWMQSGTHVPKNLKEAVHWYTKAALQGHVGAQHNLGVICMKGEGVKRDLEQAYVWALLAASNGNDNLQKALSRSLTREQKLAASIRVDQIKINMLSRASGEEGNKSIADTAGFND